MTTGINQEIVGTSKYYKVDLMVYPFLSIIAIGANLLLIPIYGMNGAAISTALTLFLLNTWRFFYLLAKLKIQPFSFNTIKAFLIFSIVIVINLFVPEIRNHFLFDILLRSSVLTVVFIFLVLFLRASEDINLTFDKLYLRFRDNYKSIKK
jgi:O-antigen/teichoic acid export membrane protein